MKPAIRVWANSKPWSDKEQMVCDTQDVRAAVEWLIKELDKEHYCGLVCGAGDTGPITYNRVHVLRVIDKAFEDVMK